MRKVEVYYYNSATKCLLCKDNVQNWLCSIYSFFDEFSFFRKKEIYMISLTFVPRYVYILFLSLSD